MKKSILIIFCSICFFACTKKEGQVANKQNDCEKIIDSFSFPADLEILDEKKNIYAIVSYLLLIKEIENSLIK